MKMDFLPYECQFSVEERRKITAQAISMIRKNKGYTQKQVAQMLGVSQPSYSSYENGNTNVPTEILVRLSYLFETSVDVLVQRDRLYTTDLDAKEQIEQYQKQVMEMMSGNGAELPNGGGELLGGIMQMLDGMKKIAENPELAEQINQTLEPNRDK